jgi:hypothetical protein
VRNVKSWDWAKALGPVRCRVPSGSADQGRGTLSVLFRTKQWLTLSQLVRAWASELAESGRSANQVEHDLTHFLVEDIVNGRLDQAGPLEQGRRLGLRFITPDGGADYLDRHRANRMLSGRSFSFVSSRILIMKEAVLDFAHRHELPPPSWWPAREEPAIRQTGVPGRPTSIYLVEIEYRARWDRGETKVSIGDEAEILCAWLRDKHPDAPQLTAKTIANRLRDQHRRLAETRK